MKGAVCRGLGIRGLDDNGERRILIYGYYLVEQSPECNTGCGGSHRVWIRLMANDIKLRPKEEGRREMLRGFAVGVKCIGCK